MNVARDECYLSIYALRSPNLERLPLVISYMRELGAPTIGVVQHGDRLVALDGAHRLAAAAALGLKPKIYVIPPGEKIEAITVTYPELEEQSHSRSTALELVQLLFKPEKSVLWQFGYPLSS